MMASYGLLKLDKPVAPFYTPHYDIRIFAMCLKKMMGMDKIEKGDLPKVHPLKMNEEIDKLLSAVNSIPEVGEDDILY